MIQPNQPTSGTNAAGAGVILSTATKAVLVALVAVHVLPWNDGQTASVALAISALIDVFMYFGGIRPSLSAQLTAAAAAVPPGAVAVIPPPPAVVAVQVEPPIPPPPPPPEPEPYHPYGRHEDPT